LHSTYFIPIYLVALQSVWVLTTHVTYSTRYRRSGYAPGFTDKQTNVNQKQTTKENLSIIPSLNKEEKPNNYHMQVGLDLGFHGLILWGWFSCIVEISEVFNVNWALWVICFVAAPQEAYLKGEWIQVPLA
jgi:hypothetical protein